MIVHFAEATTSTMEAYLQYTACRITMLPRAALHLTHVFDLSYFLRPEMKMSKGRRAECLIISLCIRASVSADGFPHDAIAVQM